MKRTLTLFSTFFIVLSVLAQSNFGKIQGTITDAKTKAPIAYATIIVQKDGVNKGGAYSDAEGNYAVSALEPGEYSITVKYLSYTDKVVTGVTVNANSITFQNIEMSEGDAEKIGVVTVTAGRPMIEKDKNQTTLSGEEIKKLPTRDLNAIAATTSGVTQTSSGLSFMGSRSDGNAYYVDGVRVIGSNSVIQATQGQIDVIQSGIPAAYGDFTGGAINVTTRGPSRFVRRTFEMISSSPFDPYHYNQIELSSTGPIWVKNKGGGDEEFVALGYLAAANLRYQNDPNPGYGGFYVVNDATLAEIEANPLAPNPSGPGLVPRSSLVTQEDLVLEKARRNVAQYVGNALLRLEYQPTKNSTLSLFGSYTGAQGSNFQYNQYLLNYEQNSTTFSQTLRTYVKFTQRLQTEDPNNKEEEKSLFSDAYYNVRLDYQSVWNETQNPVHQDNFFDYGYLGRFTSYRQPVYLYNNNATDFVDQNGDTVTRQGFWELAGFGNSEITFERADINTARGNYTQNFFDEAERTGQNVFSSAQVLNGLGLLNGFNANSTYSLWSNPGTVAYFYSKSQYERLSAYAQGNATLNLKNSHDLQFGLYYEQTFSSSWAVAANNLWVLMPQLANRHISNLDKVTEGNYIVTGNHSYDDNGTFTDTVSYNIRIDQDQQSTFDKNLRARLIEQGARDVNGELYTETSWIDVNSLNPDIFSLDLFGPNDLWNNGNPYIAYSGYDYLGNRTRNRYGLNDWSDESRRAIGSFSPVYSALWLEDKFAYKDLILRLGVRIERYDANQNVLKDQYSLYPTYSVAEAINKTNDNLELNSVPSNIGDDFVVYVDDATNPTRVLGYRDGSTWYNAEGTELTSSATLAQESNNGRIQPYLVSDDETIVSETFEDYQPQINVLPRVYFSFPINNEALFFASYDVLAQRPTDGAVFASYNEYEFLQFNQGGVLSNAALKPRVTTLYELGFKQTLTKRSSLQIIASYRESRGDFGLVRIDNAYPVSYNSYSNIDFSTIKAFRAEYELRGEGRVSLGLRYRLLFSDGTGSNINSSAALIQANLPNLRSLYPTEYDVRHQITSVLDYRFKNGKDYTGPVWFGKKVFENTGANFIVTAKSGEPFTAYANAVPSASSGTATRQLLEGNPYGSRKPWQFKIDARFDKSFRFEKRTVKDQYRSTYTEMIVFLWVENLLNTRIVRQVYGYTGLPNDDGWLSSPQGQQQIQNELNSQSYIDLYNAKVDYPYYYDTPRWIKLGVKFQF
ncbi:TonB-dependent receptor [bacterium]|nr:TonB-dependent receptor [bacterium]